MENKADESVVTQRYLVYENNVSQGPYYIEELMKHGLSSETLVKAEGTDTWIPAWQVSELRDVMSGRTATRVQTCNAIQTATGTETHEDTVEDTGTKPDTVHKSHRKFRIAVLVAAAVLLFAMYATCPDASRHKAAVSEEVRKAVDDISDLNDSWGFFGNMLASGMVSIAVDRLLEVDNYFIFSVGTVHYDGRSQAVSFGILGHVFTFDAGYFEQAMEKDRSF